MNELDSAHDHHRPGAAEFGVIPSLWARLGARLFDELLFLGARLPLTLPFVRLGGRDGFVLDAPTWAIVVSVLLPVVYDFLSVAVWGATPGKALLGLRVRSVVDGGRVAVDRAALRAVIPVLGSILALAAPAGDGAALLTLVGPFVYASVSWDVRRRGLHDKAAGTIVVRSGR